jgi:hypothetical protein
VDLLFDFIVIYYYNQSNRGKDFLIYYNNNKKVKSSKVQKGSKNLKFPRWVGWDKGIYLKKRRRARKAGGSEGGQKFLPPTPFLFARPSENYQKSASGFSLKKVRILFKTDSQLGQDEFPASLGASPLASADEFSSNFQTSQSFIPPQAGRKAAIFCPKAITNLIK